MTNNITLNSICYGCRACQHVCSKDVISFIEDSEGFLRPQIYKDKCIDCGACLKVCPVNNSDKIKNDQGEVYAAQVKDKKLLMKSSSGGVFSVIAEYVLDNNGIVFGAAMDSKLYLRHIGIENKSDLDSLRGSKYFQSDTLQTYKDVKNYLRTGKLVYYTGTPCQIAGLRLFLKRDYENLITSDLICHGTPSKKIFHLFVKQMEKERFSKIVKYKFRDKRKGWGCSSSSSSVFLRILKYEIMDDLNMRAYFAAFINGHITRTDCYSCKYCSPERVGDITIADYWGIQELYDNLPFDYKLGVSLVTLNTEKAKMIWGKLSDKFYFLNSSIDMVLKSDNRNFHSQTILPPERKDSYIRAFSNLKKFRSNYVKDGFYLYSLKKFYRKLFR